MYGAHAQRMYIAEVHNLFGPRAPVYDF